MFESASTRRCRNYLHRILLDLRSQVENEDGFTPSPGALGLKVWILPRWYYRLVLNDCHMRKSVADLVAPVKGLGIRLRMIGEIRGWEPESSGIRWTVGKGLLSHVIFSEEARPWTGFVHDREWPEGLEKYSPLRFKTEAGDLWGLDQEEIGTLRSIYGAAVAAPLRVKDLPPFGCVCAHTPSGVALSDTEIDIVGGYCALASPAIVKVVLDHTNYFS